MPRHDHVVCPFCALLCDDLTVEASGATVTTTGGCAVAEHGFLAATAQPLDPLVEGHPASLDEAIAHAAATLAQARRPLVLLLGYQTNAAVGMAAALAARLGAVLDGSAAMVATLDALASTGLASATLGEVRNRADVVVCWRADPLTTHPRLLERVVDAHGVHRPCGRADRTLVVVDSTDSPTARVADLVVSPDPGGAIDLLWALGLLVKSAQAAPLASTIAGLSWAEVSNLAGLLRGATYGALFYPDTPSLAAIEVKGLLGLADNLNAISRWAAFVLPSGTNAWGAAAALAAVTGFGHSIVFEDGVPHHDGRPAAAFLEAHAVDAVLVIGAPPGGDLAYLGEVLVGAPIVVVEGCDSPLGKRAVARLPVAPLGMGMGGTMARLDRVTLPLRSLVASAWPADNLLLHRLLEEVTSRVA